MTLTGSSPLDAGASVIQALHGRYSGQPASLPGGFTLNGKRCDATISVAVAPWPQPAVAVPAAAAQVSTQDKPPGRSKPNKPHGERPNS